MSVYHFSGHQKCLGLKWKFFLKKGYSKSWSAKFVPVPPAPKLGAKSPPMYTYTLHWMLEFGPTVALGCKRQLRSGPDPLSWIDSPYVRVSTFSLNWATFRCQENCSAEKFNCNVL